MLGQASNSMLAQAEQGIQSKVAAQFQSALSKVVNAGLTIMYAPQNKEMRLQRMAQAGNPASDAGAGAARMISNLYAQSNKQMPLEVVVPASMIFAFEYLDLLVKVKRLAITPDLIAATTQAVADAVLPMFGVSKDHMTQLVAYARQQRARQNRAR
ncbi:hypothetical protein ACO0K9_12210 [Undibacterium sp. Ji50W]|uniref:hypothetical protein n=1 Tax=Undibacterium sp. Ji50W TaxID=3413041 RepID=UPI003BF39347